MRPPPTWEQVNRDTDRLKVSGGYLYRVTSGDRDSVVFAPQRKSDDGSPIHKPKYDESGFVEWLRAQYRREDGVGHLSRETKTDVYFPQQATCRQVRDYVRRTNNPETLTPLYAAIEEFRRMLKMTVGVRQGRGR